MPKAKNLMIDERYDLLESLSTSALVSALTFPRGSKMVTALK